MAPLYINGSFEHIDIPRRIIEDSAVQIRAKYAVVTAALGVNGLAARQVYTWDCQSVPGMHEVNFEGEVDRLAWMDRDVLAINADGVRWFVNKLTPADQKISAEVQGRAVTNFGEDVTPLLPLPVHYELGFATNRVIYVFEGGNVYGLRRLMQSGENLEVNRTIHLPATRIYGGQSYAMGVVLDTDVGTFVAGPNIVNPWLASAEPNVVVRSFNQSSFYKYQVWSLKEDRIEINVLI